MSDESSMEIVTRPARRSPLRPFDKDETKTHDINRAQTEFAQVGNKDSITSENTYSTKSEYHSTTEYIQTWGRIKNSHLANLLFFSAKEKLGIFSDEFVVTSNWEYGDTLLTELKSREVTKLAFTNLEQLSLLYGVVFGLANLHKQGLCHGNIRPEYILIKKAEKRQLKSVLLPNLEAIGAPYLTAQRVRLANNPNSVTYADSHIKRLLAQKRGPWVMQDPNKDLQTVAYMFAACFPDMSPVVAQLVDMLASVPDQPIDWNASNSFITGTGPLSEQGLKSRIKQAIEIDRDGIQAPKSPPPAVHKAPRSVEYELTPPVKITTIEGKDLSTNSRRSRQVSQEKQHVPINLMDSPEKVHITAVRDERNSSGSNYRIVDLNNEEDARPSRRPVTEWTTDLIEVGRPSTARSRSSGKLKDREMSYGDSMMYDSAAPSGRKVTSIDLHQVQPTGGLESSRYTIQMLPETSRHSGGAEMEYFQHAESIKQQIQTYGPKDQLVDGGQRLDFTIEESPVLSKKSAKPEDRSQPAIWLVPVGERSDPKSLSGRASGYYNSSYFDGGAHWQGQQQATSSIWESQNSLVKTVGKYTDYSPPSTVLK